MQKLIEENPATRRSNNNVSYMLFALGALLIVVGIYLSTYTTAGIVNQTVSVMGYSITVPHAVQIQPYQPIGIVLIISAVALIAVALYQVARK